METSTKQRFFFIITEQRRGESHGRVEEPGIEPKALGLSPSSATSLAVILGESCVKWGQYLYVTELL